MKGIFALWEAITEIDWPGYYLHPHQQQTMNMIEYAHGIQSTLGYKVEY